MNLSSPTIRWLSSNDRLLFLIGVIKNKESFFSFNEHSIKHICLFPSLILEIWI